MEKSTSKQKAIKREFSAGGIVFKRSKENILWLVTKNSPDKNFTKVYWRLPKGWIDDKDNGKNPGAFASGQKRASEEQIRKAALREVKEEGGITANIIAKVLTIRFFFSTKKEERVLKFVTYYLMEWESNMKEGYGYETSEIKWLPYLEARKKMSFSNEKKVLDKAKELINSEPLGRSV